MNIDVDTDRLRETATSLEGRSSTIREELDTLHAQVDALKGRWKGDAQAAFAATYTRLDQRLRTRARTLHRAAQATTDAAQEYEDADARGADLVLGR